MSVRDEELARSKTAFHSRDHHSTGALPARGLDPEVLEITAPHWQKHIWAWLEIPNGFSSDIKSFSFSHLWANCFPTQNRQWRMGSMFVINKTPVNSGLFWVPKVGFCLCCFISCCLPVCLALFVFCVCMYFDDKKLGYYLRFFFILLLSLVSGIIGK